ncbi:hypothetical protein, partial [Faecalibaculum rodentium]|uniref:hypothetical protein n=2 Tax=Faecalibaculum rodentium TaxID=1702221 RepID=UPI00259D09D4
MISGQDDHRITGFAPGFIQAVSCLPVTVEVMDCATIALVFFFADPPLNYGATALSVTPAFLATSEIVSFSTLCPPQKTAGACGFLSHAARKVSTASLSG